MFRFYLYLRCLLPWDWLLPHYIAEGNNAISKCTAGKQMLLQSPVNRRWSDKLINQSTAPEMMLWVKKDRYCSWRVWRACTCFLSENWSRWSTWPRLLNTNIFPDSRVTVPFSQAQKVIAKNCFDEKERVWVGGPFYLKIAVIVRLIVNWNFSVFSETGVKNLIIKCSSRLYYQNAHMMNRGNFSRRICGHTNLVGHDHVTLYFT